MPNWDECCGNCVWWAREFAERCRCVRLGRSTHCSDRCGDWEPVLDDFDEDVEDDDVGCGRD